MLQFSSNLAIRGRIMAFWSLVLVGGQAIGGPVVGWMAETVGPAHAMAICGGVIVAAASGIALVLARSGRLRVAVTPRRRGRWVAIVPRPKQAKPAAPPA
jgi:MFS family permease